MWLIEGDFIRLYDRPILTQLRFARLIKALPHMLYTEIPTQRPVTPLLDAIDHPQQLRRLEHSQYYKWLMSCVNIFYMQQARVVAISVLNLGVVELTVALHYCF